MIKHIVNTSAHREIRGEFFAQRKIKRAVIIIFVAIVIVINKILPDTSCKAIVFVVIVIQADSSFITSLIIKPFASNSIYRINSVEIKF